MIVHAAQAVDMHRNPSILRKRLDNMRNHLRRQLTNLLALETKLNHSVWASREIDNCTGQRLVKRCVRVPKPLVTYNRSECLLERRPQGKRAVFRSVVIVNCQWR